MPMVYTAIHNTCDNICVLGRNCQVQLSLRFWKTDRQRLRARQLLQIWLSNPRRTSSAIHQVNQNRKTVMVRHTRSTAPLSLYRQMNTLSQRLRNKLLRLLRWEVKINIPYSAPSRQFWPIRKNLRGISSTIYNNIALTYWLLGYKLIIITNHFTYFTFKRYMCTNECIAVYWFHIDLSLYFIYFLGLKIEFSTNVYNYCKYLLLYL